MRLIYILLAVMVGLHVADLATTLYGLSLPPKTVDNLDGTLTTHTVTEMNPLAPVNNIPLMVVQKLGTVVLGTLAILVGFKKHPTMFKDKRFMRFLKSFAVASIIAYLIFVGNNLQVIANVAAVENRDVTFTVDSFDATSDTWTKNGSTPYLDAVDNPNNTIYTRFLDQQQIEDFSDNVFTNLTYGAQSFEPNKTSSIFQVDIWGEGAQTPQYAHPTLDIRSDDNNEPSDTILGNYTWPVYWTFGSSEWHTADFSLSPINVISGTRYWLVMRSDDTTFNWWGWGVGDEVDPYPNGKAMESEDAGSTWIDYEPLGGSNYHDMEFRVYVTRSENYYQLPNTLEHSPSTIQNASLNVYAKVNASDSYAEVEFNVGESTITENVTSTSYQWFNNSVSLTSLTGNTLNITLTDINGTNNFVFIDYAELDITYQFREFEETMFDSIDLLAQLLPLLGGGSILVYFLWAASQQAFSWKPPVVIASVFLILFVILTVMSSMVLPGVP